MDPRDTHHTFPTTGPTTGHPSRAAQGPAASNAHRAIAAPGDEELDALADLFLGPETPPGQAPRPRSPEPRVAARPRVEAVVLGHLPISAAAWPGQYARRRAEQLGGPAAVVRLTGGSLAIDILGSAGPDQPPEGEHDALEFVRAAADTIILRVDEPAEDQLGILPGLDGLCLLTGADDAAIVACYRKLKHLAAAADASPMPGIHLAIMGADERKGALAHERIARAARAFLEADLLPPVVIERIGPTGATPVYHGPTDLSLVTLASLLAQPRPPRARPAPARPEPTQHPGGPWAREPVARECSPVPAARPDTRPAPIDRLCSLIAGLAPIDSRCPLAERLELASDRAGRLHLVAARLASQPDLASPDPVGELLLAAAWARTNCAILAKAEPALLHGAGEPMLHLVTDDPGLATRLLGTPVGIHLAMPAAPAAFGLVATPLRG